MAELFAGLMAESISTSTLPDILIPMPLHPTRLQERGFNQSLEIGRILSKRLGVYLNTSTCERIKLSPPQASLPYKERLANMKNAFICHGKLEGMRVALLDDVMTTGASLQSLAKVVKAAGASHVECWLVARTL